MGVIYPSRSSGWRAPHLVPRLVTGPVLEPLTLAEAKLRAALDWPDADPREGLLRDDLAAARSQVELDTGLALLTQTWAVSLDVIPCRQPIELPWRPVQSVTVAAIDPTGTVIPVVPTDFMLDAGSAAPSSARLQLAAAVAPPAGLRAFQPWLLTLVVGYPTVEALKAAAPGLVRAVGLLTAHYATAGRDLASAESMTAVVMGYAEAIAPYQLVSLA